MKNDEEKRMLPVSNDTNYPPVRTQNRTQQTKQKCKACGRAFIAHTATTLFCSSACYQRNYYLRHKKKRACEAEKQTTTAVVSKTLTSMKPRNRSAKPDIQKEHTRLLTEVLSVAEVAKRLGVCKQTIYNLETAEKIKILHLTSKLSFVRWSDILALFDEPTQMIQPVRESKATVASVRETITPTPPKERKPTHSKTVTPPISHISIVGDWCDLKQACVRYKTNEKSIYNTAYSHHVPRKKEGAKVLYSVSHLDIARKSMSNTSQKEYITIAEAVLRYKLAISTIHFRIKKFGIPTVRVKNKFMFLDSEFRKTLKGSASF